MEGGPNNMTRNVRKRNRPVDKGKGFFSTLYDGVSDFGSDVWDSLTPGLKERLDKENFKNTPVENRPGDGSLKDFTKEQDENRRKTKIKIDANKAVREVNKLPYTKKQKKVLETYIVTEAENKLSPTGVKEGKIPDKDFVNQLVSDKQIKNLEGKKFNEKTLKYESGFVKPERGEGIRAFAKRLGYSNVKEFEKANPNKVRSSGKGQKFVLEGVDYKSKIGSVDGGFKAKSKPLNMRDERLDEGSKIPEEKIQEIEKKADAIDPDQALKEQQQRMTSAIAEQRQDPTGMPVSQISEMARTKKESDVAPKPPEKIEEPSKKLPTDYPSMAEMDIAQKYAENTADPKDKKKILLAEDLLKDRPKDETARIRESSGNFYIDPFTGFAIDLDVLSRSNKRAEIMDLAKLMPTDKRAAFLYQKGVIKQADLDKMLEPSEKEQLDIDIKKAQLNEYSLKAAQTKLDQKNYRSPQEKEEFKMYGANYRNAVTNDDFQGQMYWGSMLKMPEDVIKKLAKKGKATGIPKDVSKAFKAEFGFDYDLHEKRITFQKESAKIFQEGQFTDMNGRSYSGRKQFFKDNGLREWVDIKKMLDDARETKDGRAVNQYFGSFSLYPKTRDGQMDIDKLTNEHDYNQWVARNFVHKAMEQAYGKQAYETMERYYQNIIASKTPNYVRKVTASQGN